MLDDILSIIAPHRCYKCRRLGPPLCLNCRNYITSQAFRSCLVCGQFLRHENLCSRHRLPYRRAWCVARRRGVISQLIDDLKFHRAFANAKVLAQLLDARLPVFSPDTVMVPIPTTPANIRRRGYDHMALIARHLARRRKLKVSRVLKRRNNVTQHFAKNVAERRKNADEFFKIDAKIDPDKHYLVMDDIFTSGSTVRAAAECLRQAGAKQISVVVVARQVRD
ncbi:hypothetical protein CR969_03175 [Candidatus Saccharibacteria bacterium]|nr:MAG: hypothetical protein CR969_03175 [Candidatus Saccharibacteria bacterium]